MIKTFESFRGYPPFHHRSLTHPPKTPFSPPSQNQLPQSITRSIYSTPIPSPSPFLVNFFIPPFFQRPPTVICYPTFLSPHQPFSNLCSMFHPISSTFLFLFFIHSPPSSASLFIHSSYPALVFFLNSSSLSPAFFCLSLKSGDSHVCPAREC